MNATKHYIYLKQLFSLLLNHVIFLPESGKMWEFEYKRMYIALNLLATNKIYCSDLLENMM